MTAAVMDRPPPASRPAPGSDAGRPILLAGSAGSVDIRGQLAATPDEQGPDLRVDLCGLDYDGRRQRLFTALRGLQPDQALPLTSDQADDVCWLRYEAEARIAQRYCWSLPSGMPGAVETIVRLP